MIINPSHPQNTNSAPQPFRDALAELVQIGMRVARLVGKVADAETALADAAAQARVAEGASPIATSLAEAIEADRAAAAYAESRQTVVARAQAVGDSYARVTRSIRLTMALAERLDKGWAKGSRADDRQAMARRQIAHGVADVIAREADCERATRLTEALTERLETLDAEDDFVTRPAEEVIAHICRDLGLDPARMTVSSPLPRTISVPGMDGAALPIGGGPGWQAPPPHRRPDG